MDVETFVIYSINLSFSMTRLIELMTAVLGVLRLADNFYDAVIMTKEVKSHQKTIEIIQMPGLYRCP